MHLSSMDSSRGPAASPASLSACKRDCSASCLSVADTSGCGMPAWPAASPLPSASTVQTCAAQSATLIDDRPCRLALMLLLIERSAGLRGLWGTSSHLGQFRRSRDKVLGQRSGQTVRTSPGVLGQTCCKLAHELRETLGHVFREVR